MHALIYKCSGSTAQEDRTYLHWTAFCYFNVKTFQTGAFCETTCSLYLKAHCPKMRQAQGESPQRWK